MQRHGVWLAMFALVAGCASAAPSTLPSRPPAPDGWVRYTSDTRDVAVTVPPLLQVQDDHGSILAGFYRPVPELLSYGVLAIGPTAELPRVEPPYTEDELAEWLLSIVSNRRPEAHTQAWVLLPEGRAVEVRFTFDAGTPDEVAVVADAIPTDDGVAYLTANCQAAAMADCGEYLRLVPLLFDLNRPTPD